MDVLTRAPTYRDAQRAFAGPEAHQLGKELASPFDEHLDAALVHLIDYNQGLERPSPEWWL